MRPAIVNINDVQLRLLPKRDCINQHSCSKRGQEETGEKSTPLSSFPRCLYSSRVGPYPCSLPSPKAPVPVLFGMFPFPGADWRNARRLSGPFKLCQALGPPRPPSYVTLTARNNTHGQPVIHEITRTGTEYRIQNTVVVVLDQGGHMPRHAKLPLSIKNASGQAEHMFYCKGIVTS